MSTVRARGAVAPSPPAHPLLGHLPGLTGAPLDTLMTWALRYGDVVRLRLGTTTAHLISKPEHVRWVLQENHTVYTKNTRGYRKLSLFMGNGLLTSDGTFWRRQRRIAQPAFHRRRLAGFAQIMAAASEAMLARWQPWVRAESAFDVASEMSRATLRIVSEALFGVDLSNQAARVKDAISFIQRDADARINSVFDVPLSLPTPRNRKLQAATAVLDEILAEAISTRRRATNRGQSAGDDLLSMLMEVTDEDSGEKMSDAQLRDELVTMLLAGHESTANALTWTWYLLSVHPHVSERLNAELGSVLAGRPPTLADLPKLRYCTAVLKEAMRLYPPAWSMGRSPSRDDVIGGYRIPAGSLVFLCPWVTHRLPAYWSNPEGFSPERFIDDPDIEKLRYRYFPFGGGPRVCIGNAFAMMEAQLILATVAQHHQLELVPGQRVEPEPEITLKPRGGLRVIARRRGGAEAR